MLMDDTPVVPGDTHPTFEGGEAARGILNEAEEDLREWRPSVEPIGSNAGALGSNAMPGQHSATQQTIEGPAPISSMTQAPTVNTEIPEGSIADTETSTDSRPQYTTTTA